MTSHAETDKPRADACGEVIAAARGGFGSELTLTVEDGVWTIRVFDHENMHESAVTLEIRPDGFVKVRRERTVNEIGDSREVSF
jgi:hypothetical protein